MSGTTCAPIADPRFDPPHSTVQATVIHGGTAVNILAREAIVTWEYRCLPDRDPRGDLGDGAARPKRRSCRNIAPARRRRRSSTELHAQYPGLVMDEDLPAVRLARELTGANQVEAVAYGTEAGHFQSSGIPAVICGPAPSNRRTGPTNIATCQELTACEAFLRKVIAKASHQRIDDHHPPHDAVAYRLSG